MDQNLDPQADPQSAPIGPIKAPHRVLPAYYSDEAERHRYLKRVFDSTAADYDRIERILAFGSGPWYRRQALVRAGLRGGATVLDVGCGTGLVAREALLLIGPAGRLTGVDPSPGMLAQVDLPGAAFIEGRAEALPCADQSVDFVVMGYALRHIGDVGAAFREFHRVLKPGGTALILEITRPASRIGTLLLKGYMRGLVPLLARAAARGAATPELWRYYWDTIEACAPPQRVLDTLLDAGFDDVRRHVELGLFSEYVGRKPADGSGVKPTGISTGISSAAASGAAG
ncbi:MAG: class I SAM-dependent methyltransferase [Lautropia sp.]